MKWCESVFYSTANPEARDCHVTVTRHCNTDANVMRPYYENLISPMNLIIIHSAVVPVYTCTMWWRHCVRCT